MIDDGRLQTLWEEATVDCYGEDEQFWGILTALEENLDSPLVAELIGERVQISGLSSSSNPQRGIVASVSKGSREYKVSLVDLELVEQDTTSAEWLAVYHHWLRY